MEEEEDEGEDGTAEAEGVSDSGMNVSKFTLPPTEMVLPSTAFSWTDRALRKRVSIFVLLPSGCKMNDVKPKVEPGGMSVKIKYFWPSLMSDPKKIFKVFKDARNNLLYDADHSRTVAYNEMIRSLKVTRNAATDGTDSSEITSTITVELPIQVEEEFINVHGSPTNSYEMTAYPGSTDRNHTQPMYLAMHIECLGVRGNLAKVTGPNSYTMVQESDDEDDSMPELPDFAASGNI
jgi:hypothetical protein